MNPEPEIDCDRILEIMELLKATYYPLKYKKLRHSKILIPACIIVRRRDLFELKKELGQLVGDTAFDSTFADTIRPRGMAAKFLLARHKLLS